MVVTMSPQMLNYEVKRDIYGFGFCVVERDTGREVNFIWNYELENATGPIELRPPGAF